MNKEKGNLLLFFNIFLQVKESQCNTKYVHIYIMYVFTLQHRPNLSNPSRHLLLLSQGDVPR